MVEFVTSGQAAHMLGVTRKAVALMIERKVLVAQKIGPYWVMTVEDVEAARNRPDRRRKAVKDGE